MISVGKFVTGPLETNTYLVRNEAGRGLVLDPSSGCADLLQKVNEEGITLEAIFLTHAHFDHILGIPEILKAAGSIPVYVFGADSRALSDAGLNGSEWFGEPFAFNGPVTIITGDLKRIGSFDVRVVPVAGHTPGGCVLLIDNYCFSGDVLFAGSIGRSDLPGGNGADLINGIKSSLLTLPDATIVCPGHGGRTTIGREKAHNPWLR